jgi:hypothetical protein
MKWSVKDGRFARSPMSPKTRSRGASIVMLTVTGSMRRGVYARAK